MLMELPEGHHAINWHSEGTRIAIAWLLFSDTVHREKQKLSSGKKKESGNENEEDKRRNEEEGAERERRYRTESETVEIEIRGKEGSTTETHT